MKQMTRHLVCLVLVLVLLPQLGVAQDGTLPFVIAFGSCNDQNREQPLWKPLARMAPDVFVFLGDNVYADTADENQMRATYDLQDQIAEFVRFRSAVQIEGIWDDHDFGVNTEGQRLRVRTWLRRRCLISWGSPLNLQDGTVRVFLRHAVMKSWGAIGPMWYSYCCLILATSRVPGSVHGLLLGDTIQMTVLN